MNFEAAAGRTWGAPGGFRARGGCGPLTVERHPPHDATLLHATTFPEELNSESAGAYVWDPMQKVATDSGG